jgi:hypothetical protein
MGEVIMDLARTFNGKKYMWNKTAYEDQKSTEETTNQYKDDGFEVEVIEEGGSYYVFTRRVVTEVIVEGQPI